MVVKHFNLVIEIQSISKLKLNILNIGSKYRANANFVQIKLKIQLQ